MFDGNLTRIEFDGKVEHRRGQQFVNGKGFAGDAFERVHRIEPHGFASHPVQGGIATLIGARGQRDSAYVFGGENPKLRPELPQGGVALYDHNGNIIKLIGDSAVFDFGSRSATFTAGGWTINGPCTINGDLTVNGAIHATGDISSDTPDGTDE